MARDFTVRARIVAEDLASGSIGEIAQRLEDLGSSASGAAAAGVGALTAAISAYIAFSQRAVTAAIEHGSSVRALQSALSDLGPSSALVTAELERQATALSRQTTFTDEAVLSAQRLLAEFNVAPEKLERATEAAVNLSAALGVGLDEAAVRIGRTVSGVTEGLRSIAPELAELDQSALAAGEGIDVLAEKLEGRAKAAAEGLGGTFSKLRNAFEDFAAAQGKAAEAAGTDLDRALQNTTFLMNQLTDATGEQEPIWSRLTASVVEYFNTIAGVAAGVPAVRELFGLQGQALAKTREEIEATEKAYREYLIALNEGARQAEVEQAQARLEAGLKRFGVTLRNNSEEVVFAEETLRLLEDRIRLGGDRAGDYERAAEGVRAKLAELRGETVSLEGETSTLSAHHTEGAESASAYSRALDASARSARSAASAYLSAARAARSFTTETGITVTALAGGNVSFSFRGRSAPISVQGSGGAPLRANTIR